MPARAHEAGNIGLGAFVLCQMSHLATWQGRPRIGIDHAVAARQWASRTGDLRLRAYTADVAARVYAADGQRDACLTALDTAHTALTATSDQTPSYSDYYEALHVAHRGLCHLELGEGQLAAEYTQQSLKSLDPSYVRNVALLPRIWEWRVSSAKRLTRRHDCSVTLANSQRATARLG